MKLAFDGIFWVVKYSAKGWYSDFFTAKEKNDVFLVDQVGVFFFAPNFVRWPLFIGSFGLVIQWSQTNSRVVEREAASYSSTVDLLVDFRDGHLNLGIRNKGLNFSISAYPSTFKSGLSILRHPKGCRIDTPCKAPLSLKVCISTCLFKTRQVLWIVDLGRSVKRWAWSEKRFLAGMEGSLVRLDWKSRKAEGVEFFRARNFSRCEVLTLSDEKWFGIEGELDVFRPYFQESF